MSSANRDGSAVLEPTGVPRIDVALNSLAAVADAEPLAQVAPLRDVHNALRETLDTIVDA